MRLPVWSLGLFAAAMGAAAPVGDLWDGEWDAVPAQTRLAAHTFELEKLGNGMWRYDSGDQLYILDPAGRPFPEPLNPASEIVVHELGERRMRFEERVAGAAVYEEELTLSADGSRLDDAVTSVEPDGRRSTHVLSALRSGDGRSLEGRWLQQPSPKPPAPAPAAAATAAGGKKRPPYWIISSDASGTMTWTIPATGELIRGRADGVQRPITGPGRPDGVTFTFTRLSPRHLEFRAFERGRLVEQTDDTLSADGNLWTEWLWNPVHPTERDLRTYRRR